MQELLGLSSLPAPRPPASETALVPYGPPRPPVADKDYAKVRKIEKSLKYREGARKIQKRTEDNPFNPLAEKKAAFGKLKAHNKDAMFLSESELRDPELTDAAMDADDVPTDDWRKFQKHRDKYGLAATTNLTSNKFENDLRQGHFDNARAVYRRTIKAYLQMTEHWDKHIQNNPAFKGRFKILQKEKMDKMSNRILTMKHQLEFVDQFHAPASADAQAKIQEASPPARPNVGARLKTGTITDFKPEHSMQLRSQSKKAVPGYLKSTAASRNAGGPDEGAAEPKGKRGRGIKRIIMGNGLKIDRTTQGAPEQKSYVGLGKHFIHRHKLMHDGILQIRRKSGTTLNHLPTQKISKPLAHILVKLIGTDHPSFEDMQKLEDNDKSLLNRIIKHSKIDDRLMLPTPERSEEDQQWNRFQVLVGEMQAGNNSPELVKELKGLLLKMAHTNRLPKGQVREILLDLTAMGH